MKTVFLFMILMSWNQAFCTSVGHPFAQKDTSESPKGSLQLGGVDAGGGNSDVAEFYLIARAVAATYQSFNSNTALGTKGSKLAVAVKKLTVEETNDEILVNGQVVEAANFPDKVSILFNSKGWSQRSLIKKIELVTHELLGLIRIPDPQYLLSWSLVLELQTYQPFIFSGGLEKLVEVNQALRLTRVVCKVFRVQGFDHEPIKVFELEPVNDGLGQTTPITKKLIAEVYFGYAPRPQISISVYTKRKPNDPEEAIGGKILGSTVVNVVGDAIDASLMVPEVSVDCSVPDSDKAKVTSEESK